jgi:hypothetical protein
MAGQGFSYGGAGGGAPFFGLEQKYVAAIIIAVVLAAALVGVALLMRPKPSPVGPATPNFAADPREIACLEGGGHWAGSLYGCEH